MVYVCYDCEMKARTQQKEKQNTMNSPYRVTKQIATKLRTLHKNEEILNGKLHSLCSENKAINLHVTNVKLMRKTVNRFAVQISLVSLWNQKGLNLI